MSVNTKRKAVSDARHSLRCTLVAHRINLPSGLFGFVFNLSVFILVLIGLQGISNTENG